jgi:hypothetical protein
VIEVEAPGHEALAVRVPTAALEFFVNARDAFGRETLPRAGFEGPQLEAALIGKTASQTQRRNAGYSRASPVPGINPGSNAFTVTPAGNRGVRAYVKYRFASLDVE